MTCHRISGRTAAIRSDLSKRYVKVPGATKEWAEAVNTTPTTLPMLMSWQGLRSLKPIVYHNPVCMRVAKRR